MALCPFAEHLLIPAGSNDPAIEPRVAILHVDAGNAESLYYYFRDRSGGIESHFHIKKNGVIEQYRDTTRQADANNLANDFAVSIETQGFGEGEWTEEQLISIKRLLRWLNKVHPKIALREIEVWSGSGIGYHTLFGAPSEWTPVAKSCPGPDRKVQFHRQIVPWLKAGAKPESDAKPTPNITEALKAKTRDERRAALKRVAKFGNDEASQAALQWLEAIRAHEKAERMAKRARADIKDEEVRP